MAYKKCSPSAAEVPLLDRMYICKQLFTPPKKNFTFRWVGGVP